MGFRRIPEHTPTSIGHICEVYSKEAFGRKASFKHALVLVYKHLGTYVKFIARKFVEEKQASNCPGACIEAFGHICEVYSKEASRRKASFKNALVLVYKHLGTYVKFIVRKLLGEKRASKMPWCLYTSACLSFCE